MVAGDWHGNAAWGMALVRHARKLGITTLLQLGDFGIWDRRTTPAYLDALEMEAHRAWLTIYAIGGNHENYDDVKVFEQQRDTDGFVALRPHVRWIPRGQRWEWHGVKFGALGGAFSLDWRTRMPGRSWWPGQEELSKDDVERLGAAPLDVLVSHDVPAGVEPPSRYGPLLPGDEESALRTRVLLLRAVRTTRPALVLHGHWHVRNTKAIVHADGHVTRVEGLASDEEAATTSWGVLSLPGLGFTDGDGVEKV